MVSLQCVNVAIYMNLLYRTIAWHIQLFLLLIAERGNWLSVWVADAPGYELETQRGRPSMNLVEWFNDQITWTAAENPNLPKAAKISYLKKECNSLRESLHDSSSF